MQPEPVDAAKVDAILDRYPRDESSLVMVLQDVQAAVPTSCPARPWNGWPSGWTFLAPGSSPWRPSTRSSATRPRDAPSSRSARAPPATCAAPSCWRTSSAASSGVEVGGTTEDQGFTIRTVNCVGACAMAPVVITGETYHGEVKPAQVGPPDQATRPRQRRPPPPAPRRPGVRASAAPQLRSDRGARPGHHATAAPRPASLRGSPAASASAAGPGVSPRERARCTRRPSDAAADEAGFAAGGRAGTLPRHRRGAAAQPHRLPGALPAGRAGSRHPRGLPVHQGQGRGRRGDRRGPRRRARSLSACSARQPAARGHPFYARAGAARALGRCGAVDPESLEDYLGAGGFLALAAGAGAMAPRREEILAAVEASGLRGRGGAGFATGRKWRSAIRAAAEDRRAALPALQRRRGRPRRVHGPRHHGGRPLPDPRGDDPRRLRHGRPARATSTSAPSTRWPWSGSSAPSSAAARPGLLGERILGTRPLLRRLKISRGGGAFVCGESTALMRSIEGKVGEPRAKYVRSVERGLLRLPHRAEQRGDLGPGAGHRRRRRGVARRAGHRALQGHQGLLPHRPGPAHRPGGGAHGHHPAPADLRHRRRHAARGAPSRRCRPAAPRGAACPRTSSTCRSTSTRWTRPAP